MIKVFTGKYNTVFLFTVWVVVKDNFFLFSLFFLLQFLLLITKSIFFIKFKFLCILFIIFTLNSLKTLKKKNNFSNLNLLLELNLFSASLNFIITLKILSIFFLLFFTFKSNHHIVKMVDFISAFSLLFDRWFPFKNGTFWKMRDCYFHRKSVLALRGINVPPKTHTLNDFTFEILFRRRFRFSMTLILHIRAVLCGYTGRSWSLCHWPWNDPLLISLFNFDVP